MAGCVSACALAADVEAVPLTSALAVPGGKLTAVAFDTLRCELADAIRSAGPLDGVFLALHGSMRVQDMDEAPEGVLLQTAKLASNGAALAVSYDLHANLTPALVEPATAVQCFRANPHFDLFPTGYRATRTLIAALRGEAEPVHALRRLPMVLGGGIGVSILAPMRSVFRRMGKLAKRRHVMNVSLCMVHPYTDADDLGWAVHVTSNGRQDVADEVADEIADAAWAQRHVPIPEKLTIHQALEQVRGMGFAQRRFGPVSLVDFDDVVGTGASGGNTHLLAGMVQRPPGLQVLVPIHDPAAVRELWGRQDERARVTLRGTDGLVQPEVEVEGPIRACHEGEFGRVVALDHGDLRIAIADRPPMPVHPRFWRELNIDPRQADAIIQKSFFHYRMFHLGLSHLHLPVGSAGPSSFDHVLARRFDHPVHPMQDVADWRPFDRSRRSRATKSAHPAATSP